MASELADGIKVWRSVGCPSTRMKTTRISQHLLGPRWCSKGDDASHNPPKTSSRTFKSKIWIKQLETILVNGKKNQRPLSKWKCVGIFPKESNWEFESSMAGWFPSMHYHQWHSFSLGLTVWGEAGEKMALGCLPFRKFEMARFLLLFTKSNFVFPSNSACREMRHYHFFLGLEAAPCLLYFIQFYLMYWFCVCLCSHACTCVCAQCGGHRPTLGAVPPELSTLFWEGPSGAPGPIRLSWLARDSLGLLLCPLPPGTTDGATRLALPHDFWEWGYWLGISWLSFFTVNRWIQRLNFPFSFSLSYPSTTTNTIL